MCDSVEDMRDEIAAAQALIDQARAHLECNKELYSEAMQRNFKRELMMRQMKLDVMKTAVARIFPK